ncbi:hypothetical protein ACFE04_021372 [Oxalis oulophora]
METTVHKETRAEDEKVDGERKSDQEGKSDSDRENRSVNESNSANTKREVEPKGKKSVEDAAAIAFKPEKVGGEEDSWYGSWVVNILIEMVGLTIWFKQLTFSGRVIPTM